MLTSDWSTRSLEQEIELYDSAKERDMYDSMADLYAVIIATEHLEKVKWYATFALFFTYLLSIITSSSKSQLYM